MDRFAAAIRIGWIVGALVAASPANAVQRFAVLMGVNQYREPIPSLAGAENDAIALRDVLVSRWNFPSDNIIFLRGGDASKLGVLNALTRVLALSEPGDEVLVFFAGHGTSAADIALGTALPHTTGALVPADFTLAGNPALPQLIVGRQDLRPLLEALDRGNRRVLVVFDSCFSGNAVRGNLAAVAGRPALPSRNVSLDPSTLGVPGASTADGDRSYPYRNVVYFAASAEHEKAADIPAAYLKWYPTRDDKAHGAFTDALLRGLAGELPDTDADRDSAVSYVEMFDAVAAFMRKRGYPQTPQLLPHASAAPEGLLAAPLFGSGAGFVAAPNTAERPARVGVELIGFTPTESARLTGVEGVDLGGRDPTYVLVKRDDRVRLLTAGGDEVLAPRAGADPVALLRYVAVWDRLERLAAAKDRNRLRFNYASDEHGATRLEGDKVAFRVSTPIPAWVVVLHLDAEGQLRMLFPYDREEFAALPGGRPVDLAGSTVSTPFGLDRVVAFAFPQAPRSLERYVGRAEPIVDGDLEALLGVLENAPPPNGAVLELYTAPRSATQTTQSRSTRM